jgi:hypothetical protein
MKNMKNSNVRKKNRRNRTLEGVGGIGTKENKQKIGLFALCQAV